MAYLTLCFVVTQHQLDKTHYLQQIADRGGLIKLRSLTSPNTLSVYIRSKT